MATHRTAHTHNHSSTTFVVMFGILAAAALVGGLFLALRRSQAPSIPATAPAAQPAIAAPALPDTGNRFFNDEIGGAGAQYADPAGITGPMPERLQDLPGPAVPAPAAPVAPALPDTGNRFFNDEIAAGAGAADPTAAEAPAVRPARGPR